MAHNRKRFKSDSVAEKPSIIPAIYQFIRKNPDLPKLPSRIRPNHPEAQKLLAAIQAGDINAEIFSNPNCSVYLLHLLETEQISRQEGMTVYGYLLALMQYTEKQPIKECDLDVKSLRNVEVKLLVAEGKLTQSGSEYLQMLCEEFAKLYIKINLTELTNFVLSLKPTEQWLIGVHNNRDQEYREFMPDGEYYTSDTLKNILTTTLPI